MKKILGILKEYPAAAALCLAADIIVTAKFTFASLSEDPLIMSYFIALYGTFMGALIFSAGWLRAKAKAEEKEMIKRRSRIRSEYAREFYSL